MGLLINLSFPSSNISEINFPPIPQIVITSILSSRVIASNPAAFLQSIVLDNPSSLTFLIDTLCGPSTISPAIAKSIFPSLAKKIGKYA